MTEYNKNTVMNPMYKRLQTIALFQTMLADIFYWGQVVFLNFT
jgi:hypothetical protein